uniref:Na_H_Exchanger domain-containing protein n=1 Tax=Steinernema glaseri TaxID=37863 RepID=A0A1I8A140_9BILA
MERYGFLDNVFNLLNNRQTNLIVTGVIAIVSIYITLTSLFDKNLIHPLTIDNETISMEETTIATLQEQTIWIAAQGYMYSVMSLFILWLFAMIAGKILGLLRLPPLLGMLLVGIAFRNFAFLDGLLSINPFWIMVLQKIAFGLILVRCGIGLDPVALRKSFCLIGTLGILSTTAEMIAILLAAYFLFEVNIKIAILFGFILAATSPAVTVPTMIEIQNKRLGVEKGVPTVVLASASIDNLYSITAFSVAAAVIFTRADDISYTLARTPIEIAVGALLGILAGLLLRHFPCFDMRHVHFYRSALLSLVSLAFLFGTLAIHCDIAGPIAIFFLSIVAAIRWKIDNGKASQPEEKFFKLAWELVFLPFLFALIGLEFVFAELSWSIILVGLAIMCIGIAVRIIATFIMVSCTNLNIKEQLFVSLSYIPKATVQAALAPLMIQYGAHVLEFETDAKLVVSTCVVSILLTATIGQLIIQLLAPCLLRSSQVKPVPVLNFDTSYIASNNDNRLHLRIGPLTPNGDGVQAEPIPEPLTYKEMNEASYEQERESRLEQLRTTLQKRTYLYEQHDKRF